MKRSANAIWRGGGKDGKGELTTQSKVLNGTKYGFSSRFENEVGTNPEELIGAAHAGCFSMQLAFNLEGAGFKAEQIKTNADVTLEKLDSGWTVSTIHLTLMARIPGIEMNKFLELAEQAKANCPISKLLKAKISLSAELEK